MGHPTLHSEIIPPQPSTHDRAPPPCLGWPELVRPARPHQSSLVPLCRAVCTPRHLATSSPSVAQLCLHLFPAASGRCRGARLSRSALPRHEDDGIQTPMAKQNVSLAAVAQVVVLSWPLYRTRRSFDQVVCPTGRGLRSVVPKIAHTHQKSTPSAHPTSECRVRARPWLLLI